MSSLLGKRIRKAREREGLTQAALAAKVGVAPSSVEVWEAGGGVSPANRAKLQKILGPLFSKKGVGPVTDISSFGVWLREKREAAPKSVPELANASGVSAQAIYNIESGKIQNPRADERGRHDRLPRGARQQAERQPIYQGHLLAAAICRRDRLRPTLNSPR